MRRLDITALSPAYAVRHLTPEDADAVLALAAGTVALCAFYVKDGAQWASFYGNQHVYTNGRIASGSILDRNGTVLFDCAEGNYSDDKTTRISTLHAIGDKQGNINTGAKNLFADQLVGFSLITGTSGTGNTIKLTLDANLNNAAYQAMAGRKGVVALYNYQTGEVLCMLSTPSFDPADDAEVAKVAAGDSNYDGAYLNRFLSGTYTPGSTFKLVTSAAALETLHNENSFSYTCKGSLTLNGEKITCPSVHGTQDFATALANSCNGAFATLATQVGGKTLEKYAKEAGLTSKVNVNGLNSAAGNFTAGTSDNDVGWRGAVQGFGEPLRRADPDGLHRPGGQCGHASAAEVGHQLQGASGGSCDHGDQSDWLENGYL